MSISDKLISIANHNNQIAQGITDAKIAIANNLQRACRIPASPSETLTVLANKVGLAVPDEWRPDPLWLPLDDIADNQIGFIVDDRDTTGAANRVAFTVTTASDNYTVDWGDGTSDILSTGAVADHTYAMGGGKLASDGHTTYKMRISSTSTITRFWVSPVVSNINISNCFLRAVFNTTGITSLSYAFAYCASLQSVTLPALPVCTSLYYAFQYCTSLQSVTLPSLPSCTSLSAAFTYCTSLQSITFTSLPSCTSLTYAFQYCTSLQSVTLPSLPSCTSLTAAFTYCTSLQSITFTSLPSCTSLYYAFQYCYSLQSVTFPSLPSCTSLSNAFQFCISLQAITLPADLGQSAVSVDMTLAFQRVPSVGAVYLPYAKLTKLSVMSDDANRRCGMTSLTFSTQSTFSGTAPQIDIQRSNMSRAALVDVFNQLPALTGKQINITGCTGAADLTAAERQIATGKGWTIVG